MRNCFILKSRFEEAIKYQQDKGVDDDEVVEKFIGNDKIYKFVYRLYKAYTEMSKGYIESIKIEEKYIEVNHNEGNILWNTRIDLNNEK